MVGTVFLPCRHLCQAPPVLGWGFWGAVREPGGRTGRVCVCVCKTRESERPGGPRSDSEMERLDAGLALSPSQDST